MTPSMFGSVVYLPEGSDISKVKPLMMVFYHTQRSYDIGQIHVRQRMGFENLTRPDMHGNRCLSTRSSSRPRKHEHVVVATGESVSLSWFVDAFLYVLTSPAPVSNRRVKPWICSVTRIWLSSPSLLSAGSLDQPFIGHLKRFSTTSTNPTFSNRALLSFQVSKVLPHFTDRSLMVWPQVL
jgi:hypothetical protein